MKRILVADDNLEALIVLEKRLMQSGYAVFTATSGKEALERVKSDKPDLMLLDIVLPDMDGYTLVAAFKKDKSLKDIPVIFITAKELLPQGIEERISEIGACDYIVKPCSFEEILVKIKKFVG
jgi:two-component system, OmpR family, alkaline phosphatase synthesis response regulator PhoP